MKCSYTDRAEIVRDGSRDYAAGYRQNYEAASGSTPHSRDLTILEQSHRLAECRAAKTISLNQGRLIAENLSRRPAFGEDVIFELPGSGEGAFLGARAL